ncbi:MAG: ArnT family glycosyltransferase [Aggregatilineales bacterium]
MNRRLATLIGISLLVCVSLAFDLIPELRGGFGWRWPYGVPDDAWRVLPAVTVIFGYVLGARRLKDGSAALLLIWSIGGAVAIALACLFILGDPLYLLFTRTVSGLATGAHEAGAEITDLVATWRAWPTLVPTYLQPGVHAMESVHIALDPPGLPTLFYLTRQVLTAIPALADPLARAVRLYQCQNFAIMAYDNPTLASAWLGILSPLWGALTVLPLYAVARRLYGDSTARIAVIGWPLIPALALFTPTANTVYPLLIVGAFAALVQGFESKKTVRSTVWIGFSGLLTGLATFANFSTVPILAFFGLFALIRAYARRERWQKPVQAGVAFGIGLVVVWGMYFVVSGHTPLDVLAPALNQHLELDRPYLPWLALHLYDVALFIGLPISGLALIGIVSAFRRIRQSPVDPFPLALALSLIVIDLSGTARGETARVWLFFMPLLLIVAVQVLATSHPSTASLHKRGGVTPEHVDSPLPPVGEGPGVRAFWLTQAIALLTLATFVHVMGTELTPPPDESIGNAPPQAATNTFGNALGLVNEHSTVSSDGRSITLTLTWQARQSVDVPYFFSALLVRPDGQPVSRAVNWQPHDTRYPVTCWRPGALVIDTVTLPFGDVPRPGAWWISLSAFDIRTGKRLVVVGANGSSDTQIGIGPVTVGAYF